MEKNNKNKRGITLVALVITIIILLILAGITIAQLTEYGVFDNAKLAKEKYKNSQDLEDSILKDYDNEIKEYLDGTRNSTSNLDGCEMYLLAEIKNTSQEIGTYDMSKYDRTEKDICKNYLEYDENNKYYKIKKSGWYIIDVNSSCAQNSNYSYVRTNIILNEKKINTCQVCGMSNSVDHNTNSLTIYLSKGNNISVNKELTNNKNDTWNNSFINIWVME